jgi:tellurite resistance protein TerB
MFGALKKAFSAGSAEVKANYAQNRDYLEAVIAAAALVAYADGDLEESERQKVVQVIARHKTLSKFYKQNEIEQTVSEMFTRAKDKAGRNSLANELDDIKSRPDGVQMAKDVYLIACDISMADGTMEKEEELVLQKIAARLGVDPKGFEF